MKSLRMPLGGCLVSCLLLGSTGSGCNHTFTASYDAPSQSGGAAGASLGSRALEVPVRHGLALFQGDGATVKKARRLLVLAPATTRRGSSTTATLAVESALLREERTPVLPPLAKDGGRCCSGQPGELDSDLERALLERTATSSRADLVLQLGAFRRETVLLQPCGPDRFCPASSQLPSQLLDTPPCLPSGAYPSAEAVSLDARLIEPGTGRVVAVLDVRYLPGFAGLQEEMLRYGDRQVCRWEVRTTEQTGNAAQREGLLLALLARAVAEGRTVSGSELSGDGASGPGGAAVPGASAPVGAGSEGRSYLLGDAAGLATAAVELPQQLGRSVIVQGVDGVELRGRLAGIRGTSLLLTMPDGTTREAEMSQALRLVVMP